MREARRYYFRTGDNQQCRLTNIYDTDQQRSNGPVLMVAGVGVRANVFRPPNQRTLVDCLLEADYDVWLLDWRACIEWGGCPPRWPQDDRGQIRDAGVVQLRQLGLPPPWIQDTAAIQDRDPANANIRWSLDHAALYDHPNAINAVLELTGRPSLKAIIHCIGSITFMMSLVSGLFGDRVTHIVSNAVSLHPVVPVWTYYKSMLFRKLVNTFVRYLDAQWGSTEPVPNWQMALIVHLVQWATLECINPVCKMSSFSYGVGVPKIPVLWRHENLSPEVHDWIGKEFGKVLLKVFEQLEAAWKVGHMVRLDDLSLPSGIGLPQDYVNHPYLKEHIGKTRVAFFAGELNACFLKEGQERTYDLFNRHHCRDYHTLHVLPGYGHLDMFIGKNADRDVFPIMLAELAR